MANHVELFRCRGSVSSGLQVLEGLESSCVLVAFLADFSCSFQRMSILN